MPRSLTYVLPVIAHLVCEAVLYYTPITDFELQVDTLINCAGVNSPWRVTAKDHNDRTSLQTDMPKTAL